MTTERHAREELARYGRVIYELGFISATEGNLSLRFDPETVLATPKGLCKGRLAPDDMVLVDMNGHKRAGSRDVSSEIAMHLLIYRLRPDVHGIVHGHPPTATAFAVAGVALDQPTLAEIVATLGAVPLARYGTPGTHELADALSPLVPEHDAILMANHGVVTYGRDLERAFMNMELVEKFAHITLVAEQLGGARRLEAKDVAHLRSLRERAAACPEAALSGRGQR